METRSTSLWRWLVPALLAATLLIAFPPFRIVSLKEGGKRASAVQTGAPFDPATFAQRFWIEQLQPAALNAPELPPILAALRQDPAEAAKRLAKKVGLGTTAYYFARGTGRVLAAERSQLIIEIDGASGATIALRTGPIFGNTIRDGSGLLEVNSVPGLNEFNALSAEINRLVEEKVLPSLKSSATVGSRVAFAGCAEAPETLGNGPLLKFIPVQAEVTP